MPTKHWILIVALAFGYLGAPATPVAARGLSQERRIEASRVLPVPLIALQKEAVRGEDDALLLALQDYSRRASNDDATALELFLTRYPDSRWTPALLASLGRIYRHTGYPSEAIDALRRAWMLARDAREPALRAIVDQAAVDLAELLAAFGRIADLRLLLEELRGRELHGSALQRSQSLARALDTMETNPQTSLVCGQLSLARILELGPHEPWQKEAIRDTPSRHIGVSLTELLGLASKIQLKMKMAFRSPGDGEVPAPAVMNLRVRHFVALLRRDGDCYRVFDPSLAQEICMSTRAVNAEASGYFLVPDGPLPQGWHEVSEMEGWTVWGS
jgi:hypothetical protein